MKPIFFPVLDNGGGNVRVEFLDSIIRSFAKTPVHYVRLGDSHPGRCRNRAAADFLLTGCDYLLFIDADVIFAPEHIAMLNESAEPIQCGIYFKKMPGTHPCLCAFPGQKEMKRGENVAVARSGTGFMRIHRSVFEALKEENGGPARMYSNHGRAEWDFFQSGVSAQEWLSEDWYFCDHARAKGFRVMVDTRIQTKHVGCITYPILPEHVVDPLAPRPPAPWYRRAVSWLTSLFSRPVEPLPAR